jgi:predicted small secreted protein
MKTKQWLRGALAVLLMTLLAGCNTMHGLGRDIERGGEKIQEAAK